MSIISKQKNAKKNLSKPSTVADVVSENKLIIVVMQLPMVTKNDKYSKDFPLINDSK